jgi:hypothetical protein
MTLSWKSLTKRTLRMNHLIKVGKDKENKEIKIKESQHFHLLNEKELLHFITINFDNYKYSNINQY